VGASVWVSSLTPGEVHHPISQRWLAAHLAAGGQVVGPTLLPVEVAAAITRRSGDPMLGEQGMDAVLRLPVLSLVTLDVQLSVRGAHAVNVAVAHSVQIPLIPWDVEQLTRAAGRIAVRTP